MKFSRGDRVKLSMLGLKRFPKRHAMMATVVGFNRDGTCTRVVRDGNKSTSSETYHNDFLTASDAAGELK